MVNPQGDHNRTQAKNLKSLHRTSLICPRPLTDPNKDGRVWECENTLSLLSTYKSVSKESFDCRLDLDAPNVKNIVGKKYNLSTIFSQSVKGLASSYLRSSLISRSQVHIRNTRHKSMLDIRHYRSVSIKCTISGVTAPTRPGTVPKLCAGTNYVLCSDWCLCSGTKSHGALESVLFMIFVIVKDTSQTPNFRAFVFYLSYNVYFCFRFSYWFCNCMS